MQNNAFPQDNFACEQVHVLEAVNCRDPCLAIELVRRIMREAALWIPARARMTTAATQDMTETP
jgi:hypothetical protein